MSVTLEIFEEKNRREAALYTALVSALILFLFYYIKIFAEADEVKPDYGIEVNFGTSDKGYGDIQTFNKPSDIKKAIESAPEASKVTKTVSPAPKPVEPKMEKVKAPLVKADAAITSKVESPVKMKEITDSKAKATPVKVEPVKATPAAPPVKVEPAKPVPKPDAGSLYSKPGVKTGGNGTIGNTATPGGNNNGDGAKGEIGDKGDPKGKVDAPLYSGKPGSGGTAAGNSLNLTGWTWSKKPVVNDDTDEVGYIKFEIKVDDQGEILSVRPISFTVSQSVVNMYKRAIEKVSFVATTNGNRPAVSTGTINIKINPRN